MRLARLAEALGQVATTPDAARRFLDSVDDVDAAFARERLLALRAALGVAEDEVAPEETVEPPDDVEEGEKLKKRAERPRRRGRGPRLRLESTSRRSSCRRRAATRGKLD